jgi:hypothetical protein
MVLRSLKDTLELHLIYLNPTLDSRESADVKTAVVFPGLERTLQVELIHTHLHHETFSNRPIYCGLNSSMVAKPSVRF